MSTDQYSVLPLLVDDIPALGQSVQESKLRLTINRLLFKDWPNEEVQRTHYTNSVRANFDDPSVERLKVIDSTSGLMIGHLVLTRKGAPEAKEAEIRGDKEPEVPHYLNPEVLARVLEVVSELDQKKNVDHLELTHIFVMPSYRGRGIGSHLVRLADERAQNLGIPLMLSSEPEAHEFFLNLGFKDTQHADIDLTKMAPSYSGFGLFRLSGMALEH